MTDASHSAAGGTDETYPLCWNTFGCFRIYGDRGGSESAVVSVVIGGDTAKKIHDFTTIHLATAERIAEACERLAVKENVAITIAVLDNDGNQVYMHRMDGQGYLNVVTSEMKARTALMGREPSKVRMNRVIQNPDTELQQIQLGCAHKALTEVLGPQPPLVEDLPPRPAANRGNAPVPTFNLPQNVTPKSSLPAEFVVSGRAAASIFDPNQISGEAWKKIARTCRAWAAARNGSASIYIIVTAPSFIRNAAMGRSSTTSAQRR